MLFCSHGGWTGVLCRDSVVRLWLRRQWFILREEDTPSSTCCWGKGNSMFPTTLKWAWAIGGVEGRVQGSSETLTKWNNNCSSSLRFQGCVPWSLLDQTWEGRARILNRWAAALEHVVVMWLASCWNHLCRLRFCALWLKSAHLYQLLQQHWVCWMLFTPGDHSSWYW